MNKRLYWGCVIGMALILYALVGGFGESAIAKQMVECEKGVCQISEEDWRRFQEFHKETRKQMARIDQNIAAHNEAYIGLIAQLAQCQARLPQREV